MALHTGYAVLLDPDSFGPASEVVIGGITSQSVRTNSQVRSESTAGSHYARHQSIFEQKPTAEFTTTALDKVLDNVGFTGLKITSATESGLEFYEVSLDTDGKPKTGSNHRKVALRDGALFLRRLSVDNRGDATISCEALARYDGTNDVIVPTDSVALPSGLDDVTRWTMEEFTFGSITITDKLSIEIDFGVGAEAIGVNSDIYDTHIALNEILPSITIRGHNVDQFKSAGIPLIGKAGTHANSTLKLRKRTEDEASFVSDVTAEHIVLTMNGVCYWEEVLSADRNRPGEAGLRCQIKYDGTNDVFVVDTTSAI